MIWKPKRKEREKERAREKEREKEEEEEEEEDNAMEEEEEEEEGEDETAGADGFLAEDEDSKLLNLEGAEWNDGETVPYLAIAKTFLLIQNISG